MSEPTLEEEIRSVLNRHSAENGSDTPDYILAQYLTGVLDLFDAAVLRREKWYGRARWQPSPAPVSVEPMPDSPIAPWETQ